MKPASKLSRAGLTSAPFLLVALAGCGHVVLSPPPTGTPANAVVLPLISGWYEGRLVQYITTDASQADPSRMMNANFAPRLEAALPRSGQAPTALERIYAFGPQGQGNVLPSLPRPTGAASRDEAYSPLWRMVMVAWQRGRERRLLRSEEEVLAAEERGDVALTHTLIIVNCPVIYSDAGGLLPGARLGYLATQ